MNSPDQHNAHGYDANTIALNQLEPAQAGEQQREPSAWRGVLILCVICALIIGVVAVIAWHSKEQSTNREDFLRDERIVGTESTTKTMPISGEQEDMFLIRIAEGLSAEDVRGLLVDIRKHNSDPNNDLITNYTLATADGRPLWNLNDEFPLLDGSLDSIKVALWLAEQDKPISWVTDWHDGRSLVSIRVDEGYRDLSFLREVMVEFPTVRAAIAYRDAPYVNLPAGNATMTKDVEKAINAWCHDSAKYGEITRFYIPDFTRDGDFYFDYRGRRIEYPELNVQFDVSEADPVIAKLPPDASSERIREAKQDRRRDIIDTLIKEGRAVVPNLTITF